MGDGWVRYGTLIGLAVLFLFSFLSLTRGLFCLIFPFSIWATLGHFSQDLHGRVDLGQHVEGFVVLVELAGHCEISTVDEEVCGWERRLERRGWVAIVMFFRAQWCVVSVADDEDSGLDG